MGKSYSRRQVLAAGGVGVAGLGAFAYFDPMQLDLLGGSSSGFTDWISADVVGDGGWTGVVGFDGDRYESARDMLPADMIQTLNGEQFLPGEDLTKAIEPETLVLEYRRNRGLAVTGSVDVDRLRSADFPDPRARRQARRVGATAEVRIEEIGDHEGLTLFHKTLSGMGHKAVAVDDTHYVQTRFKESREAAVDAARSIVDAGQTGDGRYADTNDAFGTLLSHLEPGFVADLDLRPAGQPLGATLTVDGDAVLHREVHLQESSPSSDCEQSLQQTVREYLDSRRAVRDLEDVRITVDGRAVIAEGTVPADGGSGYLSPFLANRGLFMAENC